MVTGKLVYNDYAGYKAGFGEGITEIGCLPLTHRKFHELHLANRSELAAHALYSIERDLKDLPD